MPVFKGYFNGKEIIPLEKVEARPNQKVIITILDEYISIDSKDDLKEVKKKQNAIIGLHGLLKGESSEKIKEFDETLSKRLHFSREVKDL